MNRIESWDERRDYIIAGNRDETVSFSVEHWIHSAERAIQQRGRFAVALSGGATPKAIFERLGQTNSLDWSKVWLFWSDERSVAPTHPESNYGMAMKSGLEKLPLLPSQIFRMHAEIEEGKTLNAAAQDYEEKIRHYLGKQLFDLVMLGVGEDGHTASLFPHTLSLNAEQRLVEANHIFEKKEWRMTLTFPCINQSKIAVIYAIGPTKQAIVPKVLQSAILSPYPASRVGSPENKALWILDNDSSKFLVT